MRQSILDHYQHQSNKHPSIFNDASEAILELMRVNSFLPWLILSSQQKQHCTQTNKFHSRSLTGSFSFSDKWNLMKMKKNKARRSCCSLDTVLTDYEENDLIMSLSSESVPSVNTTSRYRSLLKRVKASFLVHSPRHHHPSSTSTSFTILSDNSTTTLASLSSSWASWKK